MTEAAKRELRPRRSRGFTLIEMSIVLVVGGFLATAGIGAYKQWSAKHYVDVNNERIKTIRQALADHVRKNGDFPCVASYGLLPSDPNYGREIDCAAAGTPAGTFRHPGTVSLPSPTFARVGAVPTRTLNLPDDYIADTDGNMFNYAVSEDQAKGAPVDPAKGTIRITDGTNTLTNNALFAVTSAGRDGRGAYRRDTGGSQPIPCPTGGAIERDNCTIGGGPVTSFVAAPRSTAAGNNHFDDLVTFSAQIDPTVIPPTCAAGKVLTYDGSNYLCIDRDALTICPSGQVMTSLDGVNFSCTSLTEPPTCATGYVLTSNGSGFACVSQSAPPVCANSYVLTGDSSGYTCVLRDAPPNCAAGQVLTSIAGSFTCIASSTAGLPTCSAGNVLTSTDGASFTCMSTLAPPPSCPANYILASNGSGYTCVAAITETVTQCPAGNALTWNGTTFSCMVPPAPPAETALMGFCATGPGNSAPETVVWTPACIGGSSVTCPVNPTGSKCSCETGYDPIEFSNAPTKNAKSFACMKRSGTSTAPLTTDYSCPAGQYMTGLNPGPTPICTPVVTYTPSTVAMFSDLTDAFVQEGGAPNQTVYLGGKPLGTGGANTAIGIDVLPNSSGGGNVGAGYRALFKNTSGTDNVALGTRALENNMAGNFNVAIGRVTLNNVTASNNTAVGDSALIYTTTGTGNVAVGDNALSINVTGSNNVAIGDGAGPAAGFTALDNTVAIGANAAVTVSNSIRIGNTAVTQIAGQVAWTAASDRRIKKDILDSDLGLAFIERLKPVSYRLKEGNGRLDYGFIAQDVEQALEGRITNMVVQLDDADKTYQLRSSDLLAPLVKGMQEQQVAITQQKSRAEQLQSRLDALQSAINNLPQSRQQGDGQ